jgi:hypothetical protein
MKLYLDSFDPRIRGLVGTPDEIADMIAAYHVHAKRIPTSDGDYTMEHSSTIMLFDKDGRLVGGGDYREDDTVITAKLTKLALPANAGRVRRPASGRSRSPRGPQLAFAVRRWPATSGRIIAPREGCGSAPRRGFNFHVREAAETVDEPGSHPRGG